MKKVYLLFVIFVFSYSYTKAQEIFNNYTDGEVFLKLKNSKIMPSHIDGISNINSLEYLEEIKSKYGIYKIRHPFHMTTSEDLKHTVVVYFSKHSQVSELIKELSYEQDIDYIEKVPYNTIDYTPNDLGSQSGSNSQWGLYQIQAEQAWDITTGNPNVTVAVVDNAVAITHPDLAPVIWTNPGEIAGNGIDDDGNGYIDDVNGWDAGDNDNDPNPPTSGMSHGTHCSGTVGCATDNGNGIASIGFGISIIPVKANRNSAGNSAVSNAYDGLTYAATVKADVISNSWGGGGYSTTQQNLIDWAYNTQGCLIIAAAGNSSTNATHYPSGYNNVISVASTSTGDVKSGFSNYGTWVDVSAPGSNIYSTWPFNGYNSISGTSMATPLVAGLAGLMFSVDTTITRAQVENCLTSTCDNIDAANPNFIGQLGAGRINAFQALQCIQSFTNPVPPVSNFYASDTILCIGAITDYTCTTPNATSFQWTFSGGTPSSSTLRNPTGITYNSAGVHDVTLIVTNSYGSHTLTKTGYINADPNLPCAITLPPGGTQPLDTSCIGKFYDDGGKTGAYTPNKETYFTIAPTGATQVTLNFISFDVEGGSTSPTPPCGFDYFEVFDGPAITSPSLGRFCNDNQPPATLTSSGGAVTIHFHTDPGLHLQGFEIDWNCSQTNPPPIADFTGTPNTICAGSSVTYSNTSLYATSYNWTFNGGTPSTSTLANPTVIYNTPGIYDVSLIATNGSGSDTRNKTSYINVISAPTASFTSSISGLTSSFSNSSTTGMTYLWDFGDGNTSSQLNPTHTYSTAGTYNVCLKVSGASCPNDSICQSITVSGGTGGLLPEFSVSTNTICSGSSIDFFDQSTGNPSTYSWTFNGSSTPTSNLPNPTGISYNSAGVYDVTLIIGGTGGSNSIIKTGHINVYSNANALYTSNTQGLTSVFRDASVGATNWNWDFGDGNSSNQQSPTHNYTAQGTYNVCLTVGNVSCPNNTYCKSITTTPPSSIDENIFNGLVKIYPNPTHHNISLDFTLINKENINLKLIDNIGKIHLIKEYENINELKTLIEMEELSSGSYILVINNKFHYKIIKN